MNNKRKMKKKSVASLFVGVDTKFTFLDAKVCWLVLST
jgi:hypothetical protein